MQLSTYVVFIFAHNQGYSNSCTNLGVSQTELMPSGSSIPKHTYTYVHAVDMHASCKLCYSSIST